MYGFSFNAVAVTVINGNSKDLGYLELSSWSPASGSSPGSTQEVPSRPEAPSSPPVPYDRASGGGAGDGDAEDQPGGSQCPSAGRREARATARAESPFRRSHSAIPAAPSAASSLAQSKLGASCQALPPRHLISGNNAPEPATHPTSAASPFVPTPRRLQLSLSL